MIVPYMYCDGCFVYHQNNLTSLPLVEVLYRQQMLMMHWSGYISLRDHVV